MRFKILIFLFFILPLYGSGQDSCHLRISLLTVSPGEDLYSTFGHSALRVTDSTNNSDIVYNYGTFSFDEPGFYVKFIRGKLLYYLSTDDYNSFKESAQQEQRGMTEQVLNLTCNEKKKMFELLHKNLQGSNRYYKYDFTFDNCSTRLRDLLENAADSSISYAQVLKEKQSFRDGMHVYLNRNDKQWSKLGIDLLLGSSTDAIMTNRQVMFLPYYLMFSFDSCRAGSKSIVFLKQAAYSYSPGTVSKNFLEDPLFIFTCLLVIILAFSVSPNPAIQRISIALDGLIFFTIGVAGILIMFMWFGTEHKMCRDNYNIIWAWPTHSIAAFFIHGKNKWAKRYFLVAALINIALLIMWFFLPQQLNVSFIPIMMVMIYQGLRFYLNKQVKTYSVR